LVNGRSIAFMESSFRSENERSIVGVLGPLNSFVGPYGALSAGEHWGKQHQRKVSPWAVPPEAG
jgi:hypothetical protein